MCARGRWLCLIYKTHPESEAPARRAAGARQVRKQPNTCQTLPGEALSQAGWGLGPTLGVCTRSRIYGFHMCCVFLYLFRLGAGWRCEAPGRAPGGCRGGGALEAAAKA